MERQGSADHGHRKARESVTLTLPKDKLEEIMEAVQAGTSTQEKRGKVWLKNSKGEEGYIEVVASFTY